MAVTNLETVGNSAASACRISVSLRMMWTSPTSPAVRRHTDRSDGRISIPTRILQGHCGHRWFSEGRWAHYDGSCLHLYGGRIPARSMAVLGSACSRLNTPLEMTGIALALEESLPGEDFILRRRFFIFHKNARIFHELQGFHIPALLLLML